MLSCNPARARVAVLVAGATLIPQLPRRNCAHIRHIHNDNNTNNIIYNNNNNNIFLLLIEACCCYAVRVYSSSCGPLASATIH